MHVSVRYPLARGLALSLCLAAMVLHGPPRQVTAAGMPLIAVDANTSLGVLPTTAFGLNTAVWDGELLNPVLPSLFQQLGSSVLRYPGGTVADGYHWATNSVTPGVSLYANPSNTFDAFMSVAHRTSSVPPIITVNYGSNATGTGGGSATEAAGWVHYANIVKGYGIRYWEIGNEIYGSWETNLWSTKTPQFYAQQAISFARLMKAQDPTIQVGVPVAANDIAFGGWTPVVIANMCPYIDFLDVHWYGQNPGFETDANLLASPGQIPGFVSTLRADLTRYCGAHASQIRIMMTELSSVPFRPGKQTVSLVNALFAADATLTWLENGALTVDWWAAHDGVFTAGNNAPTLYGTTQYGDLGLLSLGSCSGSICEPAVETPFPVYYGLMLATMLGKPGDRLVRATSSTATVAAHAVQRANGSLALLLINDSPSDSITSTVSIRGYTPATTGIASFYGQGSTSITTTRMLGLGSNFQVVLPPYSLTEIQLTR